MLRLYGLSNDDPAYVARLEGCTSLIWDTAVQVLKLGHEVVLDWNQWSVERRRAWRERAAADGYRVLLHYLDVSVETAVARARDRDDKGGAGVHRVDEAGVRHSAKIFEPPTAEEGIEIATTAP